MELDENNVKWEKNDKNHLCEITNVDYETKKHLFDSEFIETIGIESKYVINFKSQRYNNVIIELNLYEDRIRIYQLGKLNMGEIKNLLGIF